MLLPGVVLSRSVSWPSFLCSVTVYTVVDSGPFRVRPCACPAFRGATNSALSVSTVSSLLSLLWTLMLNVVQHFSLVLLLFSLPPINGVCTSCYGAASTCPGVTSSCPWVIGLSANVAVIAAGKGALQVAGLLPSYLLQLFTRPVLEAIHSLTQRPKDGIPFDFTGATFGTVRLAIVSGWVTANEALVEWSDRMESLPFSDPHYESQLKIFQAQISMLAILPSGISTSYGGVFRFILSKLSGFVCKKSGTVSLDVCQDADTSGSPSSRSLPFQATLVRPSSVEQLCSLFSLFILVCVNLGLVPLNALSEFFEDVVWYPLRSGKVSHFAVGFEIVLFYLDLVASNSRYFIGNVHKAYGGMDSVLAAATADAISFNPACKIHGKGNPQGPATSQVSGKEPDPVFKGTLSGFNNKSTMACRAFNLGAKHFSKHVGKDGVCKFFHGCDHPVTTVGAKNGLCLNPGHTGDACTNPDKDPVKKPKRG